MEVLPAAFMAIEVDDRRLGENPPWVAPAYTGRHRGGKYRLVRKDDGAVLDIWFADLGDHDLLMMMDWHIDEDTPFMYLTARYQPPYLIFDDPSYLADNIESYRRQNGDDIALVRDGSKFNDSLKIESLDAAAKALRFYREHNDRNGNVIRYRIDAQK